jgi:ethanolamine utilization protein EutN
MQFGRVLGAATATIKHPSLKGWRMLVVRLLMHDGVSADGAPVLVVDAHGAAPGSRVLITSDGQAARELLGCDQTPVRWTVMGICDE